MTLEELRDTKKLVQDLWTSKYALILVECEDISENRGSSSASEALRIISHDISKPLIFTNED